MYEGAQRVHELFTDRYKIREDESMKNCKFAASRGRPRSFDLDEALDSALHLFWQKGYEGTSLSDLTGAMGINRPSLYAAFGDKESLFSKVLERYQQGPAAFAREALKEPTARRVAERLLLGTADTLSDPQNPRGCLAVQSALVCGDDAKSVRHQVISCRAEREVAIRKRLRRAKAAGDLPRDSSPAGLAGFIVTVMEGMSVQATGGATRAQLRSVAKTALRAWPKRR